MDIIGFDQQIGFAKRITKAVAKQTAKRTAARPMVTKSTTARPMVTKPTTARPMVTKPTTARPMVTKPTTARPMVTKPTKFTKRIAPAQVPYKMSAKTTTDLKPTSAATNNAPLAVVKPNGHSIPVTTLTQTTNPNIVENVNPIQRSFMPVDLPYQQPKAKTKTVKLKNTNVSYKISTDMIEPPVDNGLQDYYGK